uniref:Uncharacterized protein n=1 Tax=Oryza sativa subsp. japonica TaxID=39947 RepID=Q654M4_ORYSJ|nr:hypothetical protein [Oryza sativa Japonica Group]
MEAEGDDEEEGMSIQLRACQRSIEDALVSEDQRRRTDLAITTYLLAVGFDKVKDSGVESPRFSPEYPTLAAVKKFVRPPLLC